MDKIKFSKGLLLINSLVLLVCMILMLSCKTDNPAPAPKPDPDPDPKQDSTITPKPVPVITTLLGLGGNYTIIHSSDNGKIWTLASLPEDVTNKRFKNLINNAIYVNDKWFAVGGFSNGAIHESILIQSSDDGLTWTSIPNPSTSELRDILYSNGKFVAVGERGNIILSDDGETWTKVNLGSVLLGDSLKSEFRHVVIKEDVIVASGLIHFSQGSSVYLVVESTDNGETWSRIRNLGGSNSVSHSQVVEDDIILLLGGGVATRNGNWTYDSRSGKDRVESPLMVAKDGLYGVSNSSAGSGSRSILKREGDDWVRSGDLRIPNLTVNAMIAGEGKYIFIGHQKPPISSELPFAAIYVSEDCAVWTDGRESLGTELTGNRRDGFKTGVFNNGEFIIAGDRHKRTPTIIFTSTDGVNWVKSEVPSSLTEVQQIHKIIKR